MKSHHDMHHPLPKCKCVLRGLADALACGHRAAEYAAAHGFPKREVWELGIVVSELATNVTRHGGGGHLTIEYVTGPEHGLVLTAHDHGPGIDDVQAALADDFSEGRVLSHSVSPAHRKGLGSGLGAVQRMTDRVHIDSAPGRGTTVRAFKASRHHGHGYGHSHSHGHEAGRG